MGQVTLEQVRALADQLSFDDKISLLRWLAEHVRERAGGQVPKELHGAFKGEFPENVHLDSFLYEVRTEWEKEWTDGGEFVG
jgi:hypothetical protein